tara:strand:+ start:427 stop:786 length:360 start_codon:yes stop_codon:yes gene_type:complete
MIVVIMLSGLSSAITQAAMVSTSALINTDDASYSTQELQEALASDELKQQLQNLGVSASELNDRIASLTADEIQQLNTQLAEQPAGGVLGVLLTIFVIFIVTDMLCATDIFSFVKCINK